MTFSIIARCPQTGQFGAAIASSSPAVAARCIWGASGVGTVATQNITDPELGLDILELMARNDTPAEALEKLEDRPYIQYRQLMAIDGSNPPAVFTGAHGLGLTGSAAGTHAACAGNLLATPEVPWAMLQAFEHAAGSLAERLMQAMLAGLAEGGEAGPVHSAGLLVYGAKRWPMVDLRVDWAEDDPIGELYAAWKVYEPQVQDYLTRAENPSSAPSYGVPGDP